MSKAPRGCELSSIARTKKIIKVSLARSTRKVLIQRNVLDIILTVQDKCEFPYIDRTRKSKKKITLICYAALGPFTVTMGEKLLGKKATI